MQKEIPLLGLHRNRTGITSTILRIKIRGFIAAGPGNSQIIFICKPPSWRRCTDRCYSESSSIYSYIVLYLAIAYIVHIMLNICYKYICNYTLFIVLLYMSLFNIVFVFLQLYGKGNLKVLIIMLYWKLLRLLILV